MIRWMKDLTPRENTTLRACFAGWTLDALDVQLFSFVIPTLIAAWGISTQQVGVLGTVALVTSAIGGWLAGILSDRYGRVKVLQLTVAWYAVFTFLCGFAQNFEQFFIFRALQGIGFGGEWAAGSVLIAEVIRDKYRGRAGGFVQSGWAVGWGIAAILYTVLFSLVSEQQAWRWLFWIGIAPAGLVFFLRRHVDEPEIFTRNKAHQPKQSIFAVFSPTYLSTTIKLSLFTTGCQGATYVYQVWLPTYLRTERGLSVIGTGAFTFALILGAFAGFIIGAYLGDAIGRRKTFFVSTVGAALMLVVYLVLPINNTVMLPSGFFLGLFTYMVFAPLGPYLSEIYPTAMRGTGQGFCYNAGRGVGALFPLLIGLLAAKMPLGKSIAMFGFIAYGCMIIALCMLPETMGKGLPDTPEEGKDDASSAPEPGVTSKV
ncbi:MFS transporter [Cupriavidus taiwanensis]|uniref:Putative 4-methylmuconolactone transporter n=1 Tax=Cupriavidus taiwanensis TaxID=164546 RepID=A0A7Z7JFP3_9BURK|nr:MFS transporter [Cupriavidus taiwanensis]SOZ17437.1 putative 4-methylmuconolactone transporter [Cupriavidus taiwanensis]SOZ96312.1 putative 4-methylmuconolactone transporter [Cupriavidus taiwanensis]SPC25735.1 putative 4-methylmuconolactone transporter [Cupriavidus taiwanensis]